MKVIICLGILLISVQTEAKLSEYLQLTQTLNGFSQFTKNWSEEVLKNSQNTNVVSSGVSAGLALAMMSFGAGGTTKTQIQTALGLTDSNEITKMAMRGLITDLKESSFVNVQIVNKIFTQKGLKINENFQTTTSDVFHTEVQNVDFTNGTTASKIINDWVQWNTNNQITNIVSPESVEESSLVLLNAIYFNGIWINPFKTAEQKIWHIDDKNTKLVPTMRVENYFNYGNVKGVDAQYVVLPYYKELTDFVDYKMIIIIPNKITGLKDVQEQLQKTNGLQSITKEPLTNLIIDMPKFKVETTLDVAAILQKMKINSIFEATANFTGIIQQPLIMSAIQKTMIDVNENGSKAASTTGLNAMTLSKWQEEKIHLKIDRPFLFTIMAENIAFKSALFSGCIYDPKY